MKYIKIFKEHWLITRIVVAVIYCVVGFFAMPLDMFRNVGVFVAAVLLILTPIKRETTKMRSMKDGVIK